MVWNCTALFGLRAGKVGIGKIRYRWEQERCRFLIGMRGKRNLARIVANNL